MKLKIDFSGIEAARESIGAPKASVNLDDIRHRETTRTPIELTNEGNKIEPLSEILRDAISETPFINREGNPFTVHIYVPSDYPYEPSDYPKFHICKCQTLKRMERAGRSDRYVSSERTDGYFEIQLYNRVTGEYDDESKVKLFPCKHCLRELNYKEYKSVSRRQQDEIVKNFSVKEYFEDPEYFEDINLKRPRYTKETYPKGDYPPDWDKISKDARNKAGWICSCCKVNCEERPELLHVHHKDGIRGNKRPSNFKVLCVACHRNQPCHGHMPIKPVRELKQLRIDQGLNSHCKNCLGK